MISTIRILALALSVASFSTSARGELKLHGLFTDNMVLQQGVKAPVWGTADTGDKVTVSVAGQEVSSTPKDGAWRVELQPLKSGGPLTLTISQGSQKLELKNVLVGEVWICGGQSNMQWAVKQSAGADEAISQAGNSKIRLLTVPRKGASEPQSNVEGNWLECNPETVKEFSAVGYFFGRDLQQARAVPVGLINSNIGGTTAERWMSAESIQSNPDLKDMSKPQGASDLYNSMIAPLAPFAIAGAIWYQGESNADRAWQYRKLLPSMIQNWRDTFQQGNFPFLVVQLAPFMDIVHEPTDSKWAELRDAQSYTAQNVPHTAQVVITDVGEEKNIHPGKKAPVGARLALAARAIAYGEKIEYSGPVYHHLEVVGNKAILHFQHTGGGLLAKGGDLTGFTIAGDDKKFHNATATVDRDTAVVSSDEVEHPVAVRYGWANYPVVNLWNKEDLPASPFRTDDFPLTTADAK